MLNANLFRALPPSKGGDQENYDPDEEEPSLEPTWPHLQVSPAPFNGGYSTPGHLDPLFAARCQCTNAQPQRAGCCVLNSNVRIYCDVAPYGLAVTLVPCCYTDRV